MVVALGAATVLPALAASAGSASASTLGPDPALSGTPNPAWWGTNGRVMEILPVGNRVYLAGGFDYVGPATGYGVGVDAARGHQAARCAGDRRGRPRRGRRRPGRLVHRWRLQVRRRPVPALRRPGHRGRCRHRLEPQARPAGRGPRLRRRDRSSSAGLRHGPGRSGSAASPRSPRRARPTSSRASSAGADGRVTSLAVVGWRALRRRRVRRHRRRLPTPGWPGSIAPPAAASAGLHRRHRPAGAGPRGLP